MPTEDELVAQLRSFEESLLTPGGRQSNDSADLLAEDFTEFGSSGRVFTKEQIISSLRVESYIAITASHFQVRILTPAVALVTYRATRHSQPESVTLRSSLWHCVAGRWQMLFHQGTILGDEPSR